MPQKRKMEESKIIPSESPQQKSKNNTPLLILIIIIMVASLGYFFYNNNELKEEKAEQQILLNETLLQLDSISNELDKKILTISQLGGEIDTLLIIKEQLETEKKSLLTGQKNQQKLIASLKDKVGGYQELLIAKDSEIEQLKKINEALLSENVELKTETQQLNESLKEVNKNKEQLEEKVAFASRLKLEKLTVYAVSESGKEKADEFRNRNIKNLKISLTIAENKVAPIEGKELLIKITAPDNNVLFDVTRGSGTFIFEGRESFYSAKQEILYDKNSQDVTVFYDKGSEFEKGLHLVEVYTDGYLVGKGQFTVK